MFFHPGVSTLAGRAVLAFCRAVSPWLVDDPVDPNTSVLHHHQGDYCGSTGYCLGQHHHDIVHDIVDVVVIVAIVVTVTIIT